MWGVLTHGELVEAAGTQDSNRDPQLSLLVYLHDDAAGTSHHTTWPVMLDSLLLEAYRGIQRHAVRYFLPSQPDGAGLRVCAKNSHTRP